MLSKCLCVRGLPSNHRKLMPVLLYARRLNVIVSKKSISTSKQLFLFNKNDKNLLKKFYDDLQKRYYAMEPAVKPARLRLMYATLFLFGLSMGLYFGFLSQMADNFFYGNRRAIIILTDVPNMIPAQHGPKEKIRYLNSVYSNFPLKLTLYQYVTSPLSSQVRTYLDFFGFSYDCCEVDPYTKKEAKSFYQHPHVPILVLEDERTSRKWHLYDAQTILSALETLRNENYKDYNMILPQYVPIVAHIEGTTENLVFSNRYFVSEKSDLNNEEWRQWINDTAIPTFEWNTADTRRHAREAVKVYAERANWTERFNKLKQWYFYYVYSNRLHSKSDDFKNEIREFDPDKFSSPMEVAHAVIAEWEGSLNRNKNLPFNGKNKPNLADISMFGAIRTYEGCELFREIMKNHDEFVNWYSKMEEYVRSNNGGKSSFSTLDWLKNVAFETTNGNKKEKSVTDQIYESASSVAEKVKSGFGMVKGKAKKTAEDVSEQTSEYVDKGKRKAGEAYDKASQETSDIIGKGKEKAKQAAETVGEQTEKGKRKFGEAYERASQEASEMTEKGRRKANEVYERGSQETHDLIGKGKEKAQDLTERGKRKVGETYDRVKQEASDLTEKGKQKAGEAYERVSEEAEDLVNKGKEKAKSAADTVSEEAEELKEKGKSKANEISNQLSGRTRELRRKRDELTNKASETVDKAKQKTGEVVNNINEDAENLMEEGKRVVGDVAHTVKDQAKNVVNMARQGIDKFEESASSAAEKTKKKAGEFVNIIEEEASSMLGKTKEKAENAKDKVSDTVHDTIAKAAGDKLIDPKKREGPVESRNRASDPSVNQSFTGKITSFNTSNDSENDDVKKFETNVDSTVTNKSLNGFYILTLSYLSRLAASNRNN